MKILIADDSKPARMLTVRALKKFNVEIFEASDGEQAYELLQQEQFDLVLLDNNMPKLRGVDLLLRLQSEEKKVNVIMISARNDKSTIESAKASGAMDYIIKPYKMENLIEKINENLEKMGRPILGS